MKIFIVEDDGVIASAVAGQLRAWGYETRCAGDLRNVLGEFAAFDPQLVLLVKHLPVNFVMKTWCKQQGK